MNKCKHCVKECSSEKSLKAHECVCPLNAHRKIFSRKWSEEKKSLWSIKCKETNCNNTHSWSAEQRQRQRDKTIIFNNAYWSEEQKLIHSEKMKEVVRNNPDSYSKNNISGRVKNYKVISSSGITSVKGTWELKVAEWLNNKHIKWTNDISPYPYYWNNSWHLYFPDFLLLDRHVLLEVKGYETDRDTEKWKSVKDKPLIIIRQKDINNLDSIDIAGECESSIQGS